MGSQRDFIYALRPSSGSPREVHRFNDQGGGSLCRTLADTRPSGAYDDYVATVPNDVVVGGQLKYRNGFIYVTLGPKIWEITKDCTSSHLFVDLTPAVNALPVPASPFPLSNYGITFDRVVTRKLIVAAGASGGVFTIRYVAAGVFDPGLAGTCGALAPHGCGVAEFVTQVTEAGQPVTISGPTVPGPGFGSQGAQGWVVSETANAIYTVPLSPPGAATRLQLPTEITGGRQLRFFRPNPCEFGANGGFFALVSGTGSAGRIVKWGLAALANSGAVAGQSIIVTTLNSVISIIKQGASPSGYVVVTFHATLDDRNPTTGADTCGDNWIPVDVKPGTDPTTPVHIPNSVTNPSTVAIAFLSTSALPVVDVNGNVLLDLTGCEPVRTDSCTLRAGRTGNENSFDKVAGVEQVDGFEALGLGIRDDVVIHFRLTELGFPLGSTIMSNQIVVTGHRLGNSHFDGGE